MDTELIFCIRLDIQPRERHRNETDELCSERRKKNTAICFARRMYFDKERQRRL